MDTKGVPDEIKTIASKAGKTIVFNLDFKVMKNDKEQGTYEFNDLIKVTFPIPDEAKGKQITIYRLHDGVVEAMLNIQ